MKNNIENNENNEINEESKLMIKNKDMKKYENIKEKLYNIKLNQKAINYIILVTFIFILLFFIINKYKKKIKTSINEIHQLLQNKNSYSIVNNTLIKELNDYIQLCKNGTLINGIQKSSKNPKITALIPVYNAEKKIKATIRSIQNQIMSDIEILLVDDCSKDNSIQIIEQLQNEDPRIKVLKSKRNRGTLYTRSIGALNSKGKYIMSIDNDDLFIYNIFNICYEEAEINNLDIVEFSGYNTYYLYLLPNSSSSYPLTTPYYLQFKKDDLIIRQPELSTFMYQRQNNTDNYTLIDGLIWGKCINSDVYRKALDLIGDMIYGEKIIWSEDRIINFAIFRVASSFKFINKDGIIHYVAQSTTGHKMMNEQKNKIFHDEFINVMFIFNLTKDTEDAKFAAIEFKNAWQKYFFGLNEENKNFAMSMYNDILNNTYISSNIKEELKIIVKGTLNKEKEIFRYYHNIFE